MSKEKRPVGRPSKFNNDLAPKAAAALYKEGKTIQELADIFEVGTTTIYRWLETYPELRARIKEGKDQIDDQVEATFFKRAMGLVVKERRQVLTPKGDIETLTTEKELPPDMTAILKWLGARRPGKWGERAQDNNLEEEELEMPEPPEVSDEKSDIQP